MFKFKLQNSSLCIFGMEVLLDGVTALKNNIHGVLENKDIECIHQMRVASRRLRTALGTFTACLPKKAGKKYLRQIKRITKSLGKARDLDVQIEYIEKIKAGLTDDRHVPGCDRLLLRLRQRREQEQHNVVKSMHWLSKKKVLEDFELFLRQTIIKSRIAAAAAPGDSVLFQKAYADIGERITEVLMYNASAIRPEDQQALHNLRIKFKYLRYTIELYAPKFDDILKNPIKTIKTGQTILGNLHDCDVWHIVLSRFLEKEKQRTLHYFGSLRGFSRIKRGLVYIQKMLTEKRRGLYNDFMTYWTGLDKDNFWKKLEDTLVSQVKQAVRAAQPAPAAVQEQTREHPDDQETVNNTGAAGIRSEHLAPAPETAPRITPPDGEQPPIQSMPD